MKDVSIGLGKLAGKGVYAKRDFMAGQIVIKYRLKLLSAEEYNDLTASEKRFTHMQWGKRYLYSEPERYVNHSNTPNTYQDLTNGCDIALRDIKRGEAITTDASKDDIS